MKNYRVTAYWDGKVIETFFRDWLRQRSFVYLFAVSSRTMIKTQLKYHDNFSSDSLLRRIWLMATYLTTCQNQAK